MIEWPTTEKEPTKYWLSNLPASVPLRKLVAIAKLRWRIERDYEELKQELGLEISKAGTGAVFIIMQPCRLQPMASWYWNGAFFPLRQLASTPKESISRFTYPACNPTTRPEALPVKTERHNPQSIATLRRQIATHLARSLPRCPCCLRRFL